MEPREYAEEVVAIVLQMYDVPASCFVPITPVLDAVEAVIITAMEDKG